MWRPLNSVSNANAHRLVAIRPYSLTALNQGLVGCGLAQIHFAPHGVLGTTQRHRPSLASMQEMPGLQAHLALLEAK